MNVFPTMFASSRDQEDDISVTVDVACPSSLCKEVLSVICWHFICASKNRLQNILANLFQPGVRTVKWDVSHPPLPFMYRPGRGWNLQLKVQAG